MTERRAQETDRGEVAIISRIIVKHGRDAIGLTVPTDMSDGDKLSARANHPMVPAIGSAGRLGQPARRMIVE